MPRDTDRNDDEDADARSEDDDRGFSFTLPPIRLPPFFPEDFRVLWPAVGERLRGRVTPRLVAAVLVAFDLADAFLAATTDSTAVAGVRVVGGALVAATAFGTLGVAYVWEAAAVLLGAGDLTAVPTLTALLVVRAVRDVR